MFAQDETSEEIVSAIPTFGIVMLSWFVYALAGMFNAVVNGADFDGKKFVYSFLVALVVGFVSAATGLSPEITWTSYGNEISGILTALLNTGVFMPLIYLAVKFFGVVQGAWQRAQKIFEKGKPG